MQSNRPTNIKRLSKLVNYEYRDEFDRRIQMRQTLVTRIVSKNSEQKNHENSEQKLDGLDRKLRQILQKKEKTRNCQIS